MKAGPGRDLVNTAAVMHAVGHAKGRTTLDLFLEQVDAEINVLAPLPEGWRLRHEWARAVVLVDGSSAGLRGSTALEEAT